MASLTRYDDTFLEDAAGYRYRIQVDGDEMVRLIYEEWNGKSFEKHGDFSFPLCNATEIANVLLEKVRISEAASRG